MAVVPETVDKKALLEGPSTKKFKVLSSIMESELDRQFSKHINNKKNRMQSLRLRKELEETTKRKRLQIASNLKPVAYRNQS